MKSCQEMTFGPSGPFLLIVFLSYAIRLSPALSEKWSAKFALHGFDQTIHSHSVVSLAEPLAPKSLRHGPKL
jgi:hypothetical protein